MNHLVLNRVQEAVVVIDATQRVWLFNKQAKIYFPSLIIDQQEIVFGELVARWQRQPDKPFETDIHIFQHAMHVRAVPLIQEQTELLMLYVRSLREVAAEAMSTKLTSLGQLTANLAHEIHNPMSAIRHASDLLQEAMRQIRSRPSSTTSSTAISNVSTRCWKTYPCLTNETTSAASRLI